VRHQAFEGGGELVDVGRGESAEGVAVAVVVELVASGDGGIAGEGVLGVAGDSGPEDGGGIDVGRRIGEETIAAAVIAVEMNESLAVGE
jgi:hypothetical protein